jgi:uncharacterized repeat protein (TIGR04076 family)
MVYELKVVVSKVMGICTAEPPMKVGDSFTVRDGDIRIPEGVYICAWALQNLLPVITPKERDILETKDQDWMWRVHHVQCPDPAGRVVFKIERVGKLESSPEEAESAAGSAGQNGIELAEHAGGVEGKLRSLRVVVEEIRGKCTSGMEPGDYFLLRSGRLYIPAHRHFCLYALHAALPFLPAKQRRLEDGDWMKDAHHVICPDPAGNVIMRIEPEE